MPRAFSTTTFIISVGILGFALSIHSRALTQRGLSGGSQHRDPAGTNEGKAATHSFATLWKLGFSASYVYSYRSFSANANLRPNYPQYVSELRADVTVDIVDQELRHWARVTWITAEFAIGGKPRTIALKGQVCLVPLTDQGFPDWSECLLRTDSFVWLQVYNILGLSAPSHGENTVSWKSPAFPPLWIVESEFAGQQDVPGVLAFSLLTPEEVDGKALQRVARFWKARAFLVQNGVIRESVDNALYVVDSDHVVGARGKLIQKTFKPQTEEYMSTMVHEYSLAAKGAKP